MLNCVDLSYDVVLSVAINCVGVCVCWCCVVLCCCVLDWVVVFELWCAHCVCFVLVYGVPCCGAVLCG